MNEVPPALNETDPASFCPERRAPGCEGCYDWGMADTTQDTTQKSDTAQDTTQKSKAAIDKDFVSRLADAGEEALHRLADLPGGQKALTAMNDLRARVDDMAKKVRGIDALEARVVKLEKEVAALRKTKSPARRQAPRDPAA